MSLFYVYFCLKTHYLMCMVVSLTLNSKPAALLFILKVTFLSYRHIFSVRHKVAYLHLGILDTTLALCLGSILNIKFTTKKKAQKCGQHALMRWWREHIFIVTELKQGGASPFWHHWEFVHWGTQITWMLGKDLWVLVLWLQINYSN